MRSEDLELDHIPLDSGTTQCPAEWGQGEYDQLMKLIGAELEKVVEPIGQKDTKDTDPIYLHTRKFAAE